jgi:hypothetical protein
LGKNISPIGKIKNILSSLKYHLLYELILIEYLPNYFFMIATSGDDIAHSGNKITAAFKLRPECHILSLRMPEFITPNATCHARLAVAFRTVNRGI